jgi:ATP-binding cassette subfamily B protein
MSALVEESLSVSGMLLGRTMGRQSSLAERFERESGELADLEVRSRMAGRWRMASVQIAFAAMPALVYLFGGISMAGGGAAISIGTLVAFTTLQTRLFFPVQSLLSVGVDVQSSLALFERIFEYLDLPIEVEEREGAVALSPSAVRGEVTFEDVSFAYEEGEPVLRHVDLVVPAGTTLALVGETGSGKTTLAYLLARLYDTDAGSVRIDGVDVRELDLASLAAIVGLVSQDAYLFHAPVRENLRFARPEARDEEIEAAARAAQIHDLIAALPEGYDTVVGERGYRFSGGEKQRIAIARAVLRDPPVLILDEATSALDTETERLVQRALDVLSRGRTTIAIAHRLSTVRFAEQIAVLEKGEVAELGTHADLIERRGLYAGLANAQRPAEAALAA